MKLYLAGPEVFLPHADELFREKKDICHKSGHEAFSPFDNEIQTLSNALSPGEKGREIARANFSLMDRCDGVIANLSPFRGPSADAGTIGEIFYMGAGRKPVFAYSNSSEDYIARIHSRMAVQNLFFDGQGRKIENFGLWDNLMLVEMVERSKGIFIRSPENRAMDDLRIFQELVNHLSK